MNSSFVAGTRERKIPYPTSNPMTMLFNFVSCPNYTYEVGALLRLKKLCTLYLMNNIDVVMSLL